jgi:hypothetical protein
VMNQIECLFKQSKLGADVFLGKDRQNVDIFYRTLHAFLVTGHVKSLALLEGLNVILAEIVRDNIIVTCEQLTSILNIMMKTDVNIHEYVRCLSAFLSTKKDALGNAKEYSACSNKLEIMSLALSSMMSIKPTMPSFENESYQTGLASLYHALYSDHTKQSSHEAKKKVFKNAHVMRYLVLCHSIQWGSLLAEMVGYEEVMSSATYFNQERLPWLENMPEVACLFVRLRCHPDRRDLDFSTLLQQLHKIAAGDPKRIASLLTGLINSLPLALTNDAITAFLKTLDPNSIEKTIEKLNTFPSSYPLSLFTATIGAPKETIKALEELAPNKIKFFKAMQLLTVDVKNGCERLISTTQANTQLALSFEKCVLEAPDKTLVQDGFETLSKATALVNDDLDFCLSLLKGLTQKTKPLFERKITLLNQLRTKQYAVSDQVKKSILNADEKCLLNFENWMKNEHDVYKLVSSGSDSELHLIFLYLDYPDACTMSQLMKKLEIIYDIIRQNNSVQFKQFTTFLSTFFNSKAFFDGIKSVSKEQIENRFKSAMTFLMAFENMFNADKQGFLIDDGVLTSLFAFFLNTIPSTFTPEKLLTIGLDAEKMKKAQMLAFSQEIKFDTDEPKKPDNLKNPENLKKFNVLRFLHHKVIVGDGFNTLFTCLKNAFVSFANDLIRGIDGLSLLDKSLNGRRACARQQFDIIKALKDTILTIAVHPSQPSSVNRKINQLTEECILDSISSNLKALGKKYNGMLFASRARKEFALSHFNNVLSTCQLSLTNKHLSLEKTLDALLDFQIAILEKDIRDHRTHWRQGYSDLFDIVKGTYLQALAFDIKTNKINALSCMNSRKMNALTGLLESYEKMISSGDRRLYVTEYREFIENLSKDKITSSNNNSELGVFLRL